MKNVAVKMVIRDKIDGIMVISNFVRLFSICDGVEISFFHNIWVIKIYAQISKDVSKHHQRSEILKLGINI